MNEQWAIGIVGLLQAWQIYSLHTLRCDLRDRLSSAHARMDEHGERIVRLENRAITPESRLGGPFVHGG